jgi:ferredoxin--NADP+ reductase
VIGTNKKDAQETVDNLVEDLGAGKIPEREAAKPPLEELLSDRKPDAVVSFQGWEAIDAAEKSAGEPHGRPRVKFCRVDEMLEASRAGQPVGAE